MHGIVYVLGCETVSQAMWEKYLILRRQTFAHVFGVKCYDVCMLIQSAVVNIYPTEGKKSGERKGGPSKCGRIK